jgi:hypothetical protein
VTVMTSKKGDIVIHHGIASGSQVEHPAVITNIGVEGKAKGERYTCVNLTVMPDGLMPQFVGSAHLFTTEDEAKRSGRHQYAYFNHD